MAIPYELIVQEDLELGTGTVSRTMPGGGHASGTRINLGTLWPGVVCANDYVSGSPTEDATVGLQDALNALGSTGGLLLVGPGTYNLTAKLTVTNGVTVRGAGMLATIFRQYADTDCFYAVDPTAQYLVFQDFQINDGLGISSRSAGHGIHLDGTGNYSRCVIERVYVIGHYDGINLKRSAYSSVRDCRVVSTKNDGYAFSVTSGVNLAISNCGMSTAGRYGYNLTEINYATVSGFADSCTSHGYFVDGGGNLVFQGTSAESNLGDGYHLANTQKVTFVSVNASASTPATTVNGISLDTVRYITIIAPQISSVSQYGIYTTGTNDDIGVLLPNISGSGVGATNTRGDLSFIVGSAI